jgi:membrane protease YdiL (CAAX protease family)
MSSRWPVTRLQDYAARFARSADRSAAVVGLSLLGLFLGESLLFVGYDLSAVGGYLAALVVSTLGLYWSEEAAPALRGTALVAVFRLVVLGMPRFFGSPLLGTAVVYGTVLPGAYLLGRIQRPVGHEREPGSRLLIQWFLPGLLATLLLAEFAFRVLRPDALVPTQRAADLALLTDVMLVVAATEELAFRRVLQQGLESSFGVGVGLLLASATYGATYGVHGDPTLVGVGALIGLVFGLLYDWSGSLGLVTALNALSKVLLFAVLPLGGTLLPL